MYKTYDGRGPTRRHGLVLAVGRLTHRLGSLVPGGREGQSAHAAGRERRRSSSAETFVVGDQNLCVYVGIGEIQRDNLDK